MSSRERLMRWPALVALAALAAGVAGCTEFRPMYGDPAVLGIAAPDLGRALGRIRVAPIDGRVGVQLRNDLIYELTGGGVEPASADYELTATVLTSAGNLAVEAVSGRPTSAQLAMVVRYRLIRLSDRAVVGNGSLTSRVPYDQTVQRFANIRAQRDAEDRASRELAGAVRNAVAALLSRPVSATPPAATPAAPAPAAPPIIPQPTGPLLPAPS